MVAGRSSDKGTVEPLLCLLYRSGPPCIAAVMLWWLLCAEKIHRKLFLNCGGETRQRGEQVQGGRYHS